jgi:hypothetical protein
MNSIHNGMLRYKVLDEGRKPPRRDPLHRERHDHV